MLTSIMLKIKIDLFLKNYWNRQNYSNCESIKNLKY
jgi:hypothetical protein